MTAVFAPAVLLLSARGFAQSTDPWARADSAVVRLAPSAFPAIPAAVRHDLEHRGCRIPQLFENSKPHNVVSGTLLKPRQKAWAILCSTRGMSRVLIYPEGQSTPSDSLAEAADKTYLQQYGNDRIGYSRAITLVTATRARRLASRVPGAPAVDHDAIEIAFVEKASSVFYWRAGKWIELPGLD